MLGIAARRLGIAVTFLDPAADPPAAVTGPVICSPFDDKAGLARLAACSDVLTYEFENVPVEALLPIAADVAVHPPLEALRYAQDRWHEKQLFDALQIAVPRYAKVDSEADLARAADTLGMPLVLKTRRLGYDGKGQFVIRSAADLAAAWRTLGPAALIAEQWIDFDCEVSLIGVRGADGNVVTYALTENQHRDGILRVSLAPSRNSALIGTARAYVNALLQHLDYVGVLALEMFVAGDALLANEFAPRVHNSGHWTIEGAETSQFENHLRAILGLPLGSTAARGVVAMKNLIGRMPPRERLLAFDGLHLHDYGKEPRPGRKLGHATLQDRDRSALAARLAAFESCLESL